MKDLEKILVRMLWEQLQINKLFSGEKFKVADIKDKIGIKDLYKQWLEETIQVLLKNNYLQFDGESFFIINTKQINIDDLWKEWDINKKYWLKNPNLKAYVTLGEVTLKALPEIISGKVSATDVMFPNSSMELVQGIYKDSPIADYFNEVLGNTITAFIEQRLKQKPQQHIKILEIGAGTGGTSEIVFQKLIPYRNHIKEYCYTDISKAFLLYAEEEYGHNNPFLTYKIFNVEEAIEKQGINPCEFDIVIATNVLHATKNIRQTLRNAKATLQKNGLLLINEISSNTLFNHLTFGLLEGWWLYEDASLRIPGCPGLYPKTWKTVLENEGFKNVFFPVEDSHDLGQQIIIAESDGVVWQKQYNRSIIQAKVNNQNNIEVQHTESKPLQRNITPEVHTELKKPIAISKDIMEQKMNDYIRTNIRESISSILKMKEEKIQDDRSFWEYGVDSILGVKLVNLLNKELNITLQTTVLFDYNNVNKLVKQIIKEYNPDLAPLMQENIPDVDKLEMKNEEAVKTISQKTHNKVHYNSILNKNRFSAYDNKIHEDYINEKNQALQHKKEPIAIIGMSGRFAKSDTVDELWKHLSNGTDLIEKVSRWDLSQYFSNDEKYCDYGSFLDNIDKFDAKFFNISGREAIYMDPQQRIFLEESWKALEDAGYAGENVDGRSCGVYVGCVRGDYHQLFNGKPPAQAFWGNSASVIPARIAYFLNLQGPAIAIDTACSSSLVAIHLACQSLWANEVEMALAGGVFINFTEEFYLSCNRASMLSPTGHCHTFDEKADGFVPGEGVGAIILKPLKNAINDGDHIYGVIRGSGMNQDGSTNGITAPSANSQEHLERHVYDSFDINPEQIQLIETHGTGTKLGDPIEYQALTRTFRQYTDKNRYCALGSIKTNLGHAATAAGVASVIKVLLALKYKKMPPSINFETGNPNIQFENSPFYVNTDLQDWNVDPSDKRCAAVSSFGFSGTNVHMVIEEAPVIEECHLQKHAYLIVLSARTFDQLRLQALQLVEHCEKNELIDCGNMSFTLMSGRKHINHRLACVAKNTKEVIGFLKKWLEKGKTSQVLVSEINENNIRELLTLKRFGNQCIENCKNLIDENEYLENLTMIGELYIQGYNLDFEKLYSNEKYLKISLPTYPFAKESYWVLENQMEFSNMAKKETAAMLEKTIEDRAKDSKNVLRNIGKNESDFDNTSINMNKILLMPLENNKIDSNIEVNKEMNAIKLTISSDLPQKVEKNFEAPSIEKSESITSIKVLKEELSKSLAAALYINRSDIDEDRQFIDMGMDSIIGVEWIQEINKKYGTTILATKIYDYPTINEFAEFLQKNIANGQGNNQHISANADQNQDVPRTIQPQKTVLSTKNISIDDKIQNQKQTKTISNSISIKTLKEELAVSLANALYINRSDINEDRQFIDMGMDSIIGVEWIQEINKKYGTTILATKIYDYPTINEFAGFLQEELNKQDVRYGEETNPVSNNSSILQDYEKKSIEITKKESSGIQLTSLLEKDSEYENKEKDILNDNSAIKLKNDNFVSANMEKSLFEENTKKLAIKSEILANESTYVNHDDSAIAIIGMSGQFPKSKTLDEFWDNIAKGRDCISEIPVERWSNSQCYDPDEKIPNKTYSKWMGVLENVDKFDPLFFNISPKDAELMDPQQRIFLENCWHCIEDAGLSMPSLSGSRCGVFVGCAQSDYGQLIGDKGLNAQGLLGGQASFISARISYLLNLKGPCLSIDTACSSSLVAIAEACNSLLFKNSDIALAGGVYVMAGPSMHIMCSKGEMLSKDGKCFTFDSRANGFVPGEGVGVILLKRLSDAVKDKDSIYGVIRGWGINQDGKTNGITAPSAKSQANLERDVYQKFGINPETITMIEAHGTGTKLGDPIEVEALTNSFHEFTHKKNYCALGSVKSNIGHLLTAAGVSGVIKAVLSLKNKMIPPTINFEKINDHILLEDSPFYINTELRPWQVNEGIPKRAAISSFGLSGTNAHLVIEEYIPNTHNDLMKPSIISNNDLVFTLSAKSEEQLRLYAKSIKTWIESNKDFSIQDLAYTLQVGRMPMDNRLAFLADSREKILNNLQEFIDNNLSTEILTANTKNNKEEVIYFEEEEDAKKLIETWLKNRKLKKIAELWVKGLNIDWNNLYCEIKPCRISLPTYPFVREKYWLPIEEKEVGYKLSSQRSIDIIHPLVQKNTSNFSEQKFSSTFTGQEFFISDHIIKGKKILPGVAHLEMVRESVEKSIENLKEGEFGIHIKNVVWIRPFIVEEQPEQIHIGLFPKDNEYVSYQIYGEEKESNSEQKIYSRGTIFISKPEKAPILDLSDKISQCGRKILTSGQCYDAFKKIGFEYGDSYKGIEKVYLGLNQMVAKVSLDDYFFNSNQFILHPGLLDSALQSCINLVLDSDEYKPMIPFEIEEVKIFSKCLPQMWAVINRNNKNTDDSVQKLNVDLCNSEGEVCVSIKGFSTRILKSTSNQEKSSTTFDTLMLQPIWKEEIPYNEKTNSNDIERVVMLCELEKNYKKIIEKNMNFSKCITLESDKEELEDRFQDYAIQVFRKVQRTINTNPSNKILIQIVIGNKEEQSVFSSLSGLLKTAQLESSKLIGQIIEVSPDEDSESIIKKLEENSQIPTENHIRYKDGKRMVIKWEEIDYFEKKQDIPWKDGGTYLITGGAGGLGLIFAKEIANKVKDAVIVLTGRSSLNEDKKAKIKDLEKLNAKVVYKQMDVTKQSDVIDLIYSLTYEFGTINGIIHSAGIILDNFIVKKTRDEFLEVMAPKVKGLVNLDKITKNINLDFFIIFSSIAGIVGNPSQVDYSTANAFMNTYAEYRNKLVKSKERHGQTISINWSLWKEGGMHVDEENEKMLMHILGITTMSTATGIEALYKSFTSGKSQIMVAEGDIERMKEKLISKISTEGQDTNNDSEYRGSPVAEGKESLMERIRVLLTQNVSQLLKMKIKDVDSNTELTKYGFDSITWTEFSNKLNKQYNLEVNPTVFFEHPTIKSLSQYFAEEYKGIFIKQFEVKSIALEEKSAENSITYKLNKDVLEKRKHSRFIKQIESDTQRVNKIDSEPIAIVGMSGKFPMSEDIEEFWLNLKEGKDCISEVPKDRWDWKEYYGDPVKEINKTNIKWGGFIDGVDEFEPLFFGISPKEAKFMDPQQRLLMTYVWKTIEDAGYSAQSLSGTKTGIFVGTANTGYSNLISQANLPIESYMITSIAPSVGPNRMSYYLNLHGPSEPIETACSSSLVAIHRAVTAIGTGTCDMAIVGGVNTIVSPDLHISFSKAGMLCEDGRCKTFSDKANGYVRGEGVGMIMLKRLKDAEREGDQIYGIIRATAENHGGHANSLTAPNPKAQAELLQTAYTKAGIDPRTVTYMETHGTGTELGDPIEINGLKTAFKELYKSTGDLKVLNKHCGLGSVKTNIGHLELAAGIAGVIKVLLQLKHKTLVKSLHCDTINPYIKLEDSPFYILQESKEWESLVEEEGRQIPRRAGISSFGFGGANAHVVIEEYIQDESKIEEGKMSSEGPAIILLSAKNENRLKDQAKRLLDAIQKRTNSDLNLIDLAYTLQVGREAFSERLGIVVYSINELEEKLKGFLEDQDGIHDFYRGQTKRNKDTFDIFNVDEELQEAIDKWIQRKKYSKLLELWVKGLTIDWNKLYDDIKPHKISLPTYPFAKEKYWVPREKVKFENSKKAANTVFIDSDKARKQHKIAKPSHAQTKLELYESPLNGKKEIKNTHSKIQDKPTSISLQSLSMGSEMLIKPEIQIQDSNIVRTVSEKYTNAGMNEDKEINSNVKEKLSLELLQEHLTQSLAEVLNISADQIEGDERFIDMGLDSITGVDWIQKINKQYQTSIKATKVYDYPSINEFTKFLKKELSKNKKSIHEYSKNSKKDTKIFEELQRPNDLTAVTSFPTVVENVIEEKEELLQQSISLESLQEELIVSLAKVLHMNADEIDGDEKFVEMGLDSITGVEWIQAISQQYGISIKATKVYDYPSVNEFAKFLKKTVKKEHKEMNQIVSISEDEILQQVQTGKLDIEKAMEMLSQ